MPKLNAAFSGPPALYTLFPNHPNLGPKQLCCLAAAVGPR